MKNLKLNLEGLQYKDSQNKVKKQLERLNGVEEICMDIDHKSVDVTFDWPATEVEIKQCIENNGFKVL